MPISMHKATYFFHRYLDKTDPEKSIRKWNDRFTDDPTTPEEIEGFLTEMISRTQAGQRESEALEAIVAGSTELVIVRPRTAPPHDPDAPVVPTGPMVVVHEGDTPIAPVLTIHEGEAPAGELPVKPKKKLFAKKEK